MGWCSWNAYHRKFDETVFYETADAMKANGMQAAGYEYINVDGGETLSLFPERALIPMLAPQAGGMAVTPATSAATPRATSSTTRRSTHTASAPSPTTSTSRDSSTDTTLTRA